MIRTNGILAREKAGERDTDHERFAHQPDLDDQAADLRRMAAAQTAPTPIVLAVASGKGGVGKTNVAVNLGAVLAGRGHRVTLVDTDIGLANADVLVGVQPPHHLGHVLTRQRSLGQVAVPTPSGMRLVAGATAGSRMADAWRSGGGAALGQIRRADCDFVILDCGAGLGHVVLDCAKCADHVMIVTTPEPPALADAYAAVKTLLAEGYASRISILLNMVDSRADAKAAVQRFNKVAAKFLKITVADAGYILHDTHVELAVRKRSPFVLCYPKCSASACVTAVSHRLFKPAQRRPAGRGLLRRALGARFAEAK